MSSYSVSELDIMTALCCGETCQHHETGFCHRLDFQREAQRVKRLLTNQPEPTLIILEREE